MTEKTKEIEFNPQRNNLLNWIGQAHLESGMNLIKREAILAEHLGLNNLESASLSILQAIKSEIEGNNDTN